MGVYADQLALVRSAITEILTSGQSVSYQGRSLSMADLKTLRELEKDYEEKAAQEVASSKGRSRLTYVTPIS